MRRRKIMKEGDLLLNKNTHAKYILIEKRVSHIYNFHFWSMFCVQSGKLTMIREDELGNTMAAESWQVIPGAV